MYTINLESFPFADEYVQIIPNTKFVSIKPGLKQVFICAGKILLTFH